MLKRLRPKADSELLLLAGYFWGIAIYGGFKIPTENSNLYLFLILVSFVTAGIALTLLYTKRRIFAWLLFAYSGLNVFSVLLGIFSKFLLAWQSLTIKEHINWQYGIFYTALDVFIIWLIWRWLHRLQESSDASLVSENAVSGQLKPDQKSVEKDFKRHEEAIDAKNCKRCVACEEAIPEDSHFCPKCGWTQPRRV